MDNITIKDFNNTGTHAKVVNTLLQHDANFRKGKIFNTVADLKADTKLSPGQVCRTRGYYTINDGGGAYYDIVKLSVYGSTPDGHADHSITSTANGNLVAVLVDEYNETPYQLGAYGNGVNDDTIPVQMCITRAINRQTGSGMTRGMTNIGFWSGVFAISSQINITATNVVIVGIELRAIGTGWNSGNSMLYVTGGHNSFYSLTIDCNKIANGIRDSGQRNMWYTPRIFRMSPGWRSYGYWKPYSEGNECGIINPRICQWVTTDTEFSDPTKFTADCVRIEQSDCFVHGGNIAWARTCYYGDHGVHFLVGVHLNNGREGVGVTDPVAIEFGQTGGELTMTDTYIDDARCEFYSSNINMNGVWLLMNAAKVTISDGIFRFYGRAGVGEPHCTGWFSYFMDSGKPDAFRFVDTVAHTWSDDIKNVATAINSHIGLDPNNSQIHIGNRVLKAGFSVDDIYEKVFTAGSYLNLTKSGQGVSFPVKSEEPLYLGLGSLAFSDGTSSTDGFGLFGRGFYEKGVSAWHPMFTSQLVRNSNPPNLFSATGNLAKEDIVNSTLKFDGSAPATLTMPLGTDIDLLNMSNNSAIDFYLINIGTATATIANNTGVVHIGNMAVTSNTSGHFRLHKWDTNNYSVFRLS